ncbi:ATP-dependent DNA ligase [Dactylosporangium matsuzakiense]|nr:ATP-dependent DNA ligase [Dactylosporangium matsuzakiense]
MICVFQSLTHPSDHYPQPTVDRRAPEPAPPPGAWGRLGPVDDQGRATFVLHEHHKPRHHFDLRLEEHGALRSWAVPRGLPDDPKHNRLAVAVPDHALDHLTYTDADKSIADTGWWHEVDRNDKRLVFTLHGRSASRTYALIKTGSDWLLHLMKD